MDRPKFIAGQIVQHKLTKQKMIVIEDIMSYADGGECRYKERGEYRREFFFSGELEKVKQS